MKPELKKQKQEERDRERRQRRTKFGVGIVLAVAALAFALVSFQGSQKESSAAANDGFARISIDEAKSLFDRGELTLIDVRQADAYLQAHIPGSLQIPLSRIEGEVSYLPKGKTIVTYCSCPAEESSGQAVQILAHRGITNAVALHGGFEAWQRRGYPVERGMPPGSGS